jgi:hypothetical protein
LKKKTLRCFDFFLLYTLDYVPGLLVGHWSSALLTGLSDNGHPSSVSSSFPFSWALNLVHSTNLHYLHTQVTLLFLSNYSKRVVVVGSTVKITANKFHGYKETPVFSEIQNTPIKFPPTSSKVTKRPLSSARCKIPPSSEGESTPTLRSW